jgi:DNA-3-methyladenine glycosylase II
MEPSLTVQTNSQRTPKLTRDALLRAVSELSACDDDLATVVQRFGPPPMWSRGPGFATLVRIILEQQVSLASADAAYE